MIKKTGGESVIMEKGSKRQRGLMRCSTSMDVRKSPDYETWENKVDKHDEREVRSQLSDEAKEQGY